MARNDELMHYGVKGMKWGHRKARDKSSFNTSYRETGLTNKGKIAYTKGYKTIDNKKAQRYALKEGKAYIKAFGKSAKQKDELSVIGNAYDKSVKKQKMDKQIKEDAKKLRKANKMSDVVVYDDNGRFVRTINPSINFKSELVKKKGKSYVEKVENKAGQMYLRDFAIASSVVVGSSVVSAYLSER